jgi:hypothetical protein
MEVQFQPGALPGLEVSPDRFFAAVLFSVSFSQSFPSRDALGGPIVVDHPSTNGSTDYILVHDQCAHTPSCATHTVSRRQTRILNRVSIRMLAHGRPRKIGTTGSCAHGRRGGVHTTDCRDGWKSGGALSSTRPVSVWLGGGHLRRVGHCLWPCVPTGTGTSSGRCVV